MDSFMGFLLIVAALAVYFTPWIVAVSRKHRQMTAIAVVNLFLGWSLIGWVVALAWSLTRSGDRG